MTPIRAARPQLFEELEDIQAQLGKPGLADFQRELLEERRAEVEDKLATIEGMTSADLGGGDDGDAVKSAEELKVRVALVVIKPRNNALRQHCCFIIIIVILMYGLSQRFHW